VSADQDIGEALVIQLAECAAGGRPVAIRGHGSKRFLLGEPLPESVTIEVAEHRGVIEYEPSELSLTARAGTPLDEISSVLAEAGQILPFDPPRFGGRGTLGGAVSAGLSGPARPWRGALRDAVLGVSLVGTSGEVLRFGGKVMKNVAGYDVARLAAGAWGTLGLLLDVSLKVLPRAEHELTRVFELSQTQAIEWLTEAQQKPWPFSGAVWDDGLLRVRLSGMRAGVERAAGILGGQTESDDGYWAALRDQTTAFFEGDGELLRIDVPPATDACGAVGSWLIDWGGARRWWRGIEGVDAVTRWVAGHGGYCAGWARPQAPAVAPCVPLAVAGPLGPLQRRLKTVFDPEGCLEPALLRPEGP
jgi:glycolate oxidase FAD binding subunit